MVALGGASYRVAQPVVTQGCPCVQHHVPQPRSRQQEWHARYQNHAFSLVVGHLHRLYYPKCIYFVGHCCRIYPLYHKAAGLGFSFWTHVKNRSEQSLLCKLLSVSKSPVWFVEASNSDKALIGDKNIILCRAIEWKVTRKVTKGDGIGVGVEDCGVWSSATLSSLQARWSLARLRSRLRSCFCTFLDFFLALAGNSWGSRVLVFASPWPGGGVACDWLEECLVGGDRKWAMVVCTIFTVTQSLSHTLAPPKAPRLD